MKLARMYRAGATYPKQGNEFTDKQTIDEVRPSDGFNTGIHSGIIHIYGSPVLRNFIIHALNDRELGLLKDELARRGKEIEDISKDIAEIEKANDEAGKRVAK